MNFKVTAPAKPDQWIELKSPYCNYKTATPVSVMQTNRSNSRYGRLKSRPQTAIQGIEEIDEKKFDNTLSDSQTDLKTVDIEVSLIRQN